MKLEDQVISLNLAKRLKELNVKQESLFHWVKVKHGFSLFFYQESVFDTPDGEGYSAFTLSELGALFEKGTWLDTFFHSLEIQVQVKGIRGIATDEQSEVNARAKMLIFLIEKNLVKL